MPQNGPKRKNTFLFMYLDLNLASISDSVFPIPAPSCTTIQKSRKRETVRVKSRGACGGEKERVSGKKAQR